MVAGHVCFVLVRAKRSSITSASYSPVAGTNLKRDAGNTEKSLCNRIHLQGVSVLLVFNKELTSESATPYLIVFSTALSVDLLISGVYPLNNVSSSWSDERRDSAYVDLISWLGWQLQLDEQWYL